MDGQATDFAILDGELVLLGQDCVTILTEGEPVVLLSRLTEGRPGCPGMWSVGVVSAQQAILLQWAMDGLSDELIPQ